MATESTSLEDSEKISGEMSPEKGDLKTTISVTTADTPETETPAVVPEETSNILFIRNLVRPFTLVRLKELLEKTGKLVEDQFWIDKIKSKCYATYEKTEDAIKTRETLNGISWPDANPKKLIIEFATSEELEYHLNLDKNPPPSTSVSSQSTTTTTTTTTTTAAGVPSLSTSSSRARTYSTKSESETKEISRRELNNEKFDAVIRRGKLEKLDQGASKDSKESNKQDRADKSEREKRPIREWDKEKFSHNDQPSEETFSSEKKKRAPSASPESKGRRSRDSQHREKDRKHKEGGDGNQAHKDDNAGESESPAKLLDDLYKKTKAPPCIYWLPLDEDQAKKRAEVRAENMKKREEEFAAREASRKSRFEKQQRQRRRTPPPYERRQERSPVAYKGRGEPTFNRSRNVAARGSFSGRRSQPSRPRARRSRSRSSSVSRSRSRSRSYSRSRTRSSSRSRSRSVPRKRSRSRTSRSPRRNGANYVRRSRSRSRSPPPKRMVSPRRR